jgi:hypothetical protein
MIHKWNAEQAALLCIADLPPYLVQTTRLAPAYTIAFFHDLAGHGVLQAMGYREGESTSSPIPAELVTDFVFLPDMPDPGVWSAVPAKQGVDWRYHIYEGLWFRSVQLVQLAKLFQDSLASDLRAALEVCDDDESEAIHLFIAQRIVPYCLPGDRPLHSAGVQLSQSLGLDQPDLTAVHLAFRWAVERSAVKSRSQRPEADGRLTIDQKRNPGRPKGTVKYKDDDSIVEAAKPLHAIMERPVYEAAVVKAATSLGKKLEAKDVGRLARKLSKALKSVPS